jgi:hypothetical protein
MRCPECGYSADPRGFDLAYHILEEHRPRQRRLEGGEMQTKMQTIPKGQTREVTLDKAAVDGLIQVLDRHPLDRFEREQLEKILKRMR